MKIIKTAKYKKIAAKRGTFKYKCDGCGELSFLTPRDRNRAAVPRCRFCGSTWLEPVSEYAADRGREGRDAFTEQRESLQEKQNFL